MLKLSENSVMKNVFGPEREEGHWGKKNCILRSLIISATHQIYVQR